ncbi:MAG: insulinase family protein [Chromatiales bacterium]|nr:insulinase family protein [Chromatiales bacterium]
MRSTDSGALALVAAVTLGCGVTAHARTSEFMLDNGMKVVVVEDHRAPVATAQVWYRVGSSYEIDGVTGVSHALEHMMFKGTESVPPGEFSRIISENGGTENAFTSRDYTAYFQTLSADRLETAFRLESDRMRNLTLPPEEFAKELEVVKEERRLRTEDRPTSLTYERFNAVAFLSSPYRTPVIGWMDDLDHMTVDDLRDWYARWYAPNNATLVVAGDVDPQEILALARNYYGVLPRAEITPPKPRAEIAQAGERRVVVKAPAKLPYLLMGYKAPILGTAEADWEPYALMVAAEVLGGTSGSRLQRDLVRGREIAASVDADYDYMDRLPGLFLLDGVPAPGSDVAILEAALREQVRQLRDEPVTRDELDRVVARAVAANIFERDSVFYQAMRVGSADVVGVDWRVLDELPDRLRAVTPEQVQAVARKYLVDDRLTVGVLDPLPIDAAQTRKPLNLKGARNDV